MQRTRQTSSIYIIYLVIWCLILCLIYDRLENRDSKHSKFLRYMQGKYVDSVPPIVISGHQFTLFSHHQDAARKYLEAYKLLPENPLINLCVGMFFHAMLYLCNAF